MEAVLVLLGLAAIAATVIPLVRKDDWWIRIFDFPRLQILAMTAAVLAAYLLLWQPSAWSSAFVAALAASFAWQCYMMWPYTPLAPRQVKPAERPSSGSTLRVLHANVLMANRKVQSLKEIIGKADPDVILAVEVDGWWCGELDSLERTYPHVVRQPQPNTYGMVLFSRLELVEPQVKFLVQRDVPSIHTRVRLRSGDEIELRCLHPRPPGPKEAREVEVRDAELLIVGRELQKRRAPALVMGDLNDVGWSRTNYQFQRLSGLLDPRFGRGFYCTFHAAYPFLRWPLDHFFHSAHFRLVDLRRLQRFGSDHFPICITLSYEPDGAPAQPRPHAEREEAREAAEKIGEARANNR